MQVAFRRTNNQGNSSITLIIVMAVALLMAIILGVQLGSGDYAAAAVWLVVGLILLYVVHLHHYTWQIVLLIVFLGFNYHPTGFQIGSLHLGLLLGGALAVLYLLSPVAFRPSNYLSGTGIGAMKVCMALWVVYGGIHLVWNHMDPYLPSQYAFKNALKTYVEAFGGPAIILWFIVKPSGFNVGKNWSRSLIIVLFIGILVNVAIRLYLMVQGVGIVDPTTVAIPGLETQATGLAIPVLNAVPNRWMLRTLSPLAVAISMMFITAPGFFRAQKGTLKLMLLVTLLLGVMGAFLSAGRASVLMTGFYIFIIALVRRKMISIMIVTVMGVFFIAAVNLLSGVINTSAPFFVQRTLQYFMIEKGEAVENIESSSRWRKELASRAYQEWRSDPRIFVFGRATYSFGEGDMNLYEKVGHYEAMIEISLRRGHAHRLTADCLVQYGVVGLILFYLMNFTILRFLILLYRRQKNEDTSYRNLTFILLVSFLVAVPMSFIATGWMSIYNTFLLLLLILGYSQENAAKEEKRAIEEVIVPRGIPARAV